MHAAAEDGKDNDNSMIGGGMGVMLGEPVAWHTVRAGRYTPGLITRENGCIPDDGDMMLFLGSQSGRSSERMEEARPTVIETLSGNMSFEEARLIAGCNLTRTTAHAPDDFQTQEARACIAAATEKRAIIANMYSGR